MMQFVSSIVDSINSIIGEYYIKPWVVILFAVLLIVCLYLFLSMKLGNLAQNTEKKITYQYDNIFYLWSIYYHDHIGSLSSNPGLIVLKTIWASGKSKYIPNRNSIEETILKIEDKLGVKVIPDSEWKILSKLFKKYKIKNFFSILLKSIIILIIAFLLLLLVFVVFNR